MRFKWLAALACLLAGAASGQHAGHAPPAARPSPASVAIDARGEAWVVYEDGGHVKLRAAEGGGEPRIVNAQAEVLDTSRDSRPKLAFGPAGEVYVTWTRGRGRGHVGDVRFARSLDGGATFEPPVTVHADRQEIQHSFEAIAVTPQGRIFIAWIDKRDGRTGLYFSASDDRGATFARERPAGPGSCECCRVAMVARPDNTALAFWRHVFEPDLRDHALVRLDLDKGAGGLRRATFDGWRTNACPHHGPSMAQDSEGRLHAVWFSGAAGKEGVYYGRLREDGVDQQRRVGGESAANADIAVAGSRVAIVWKEFDGKAARLKALRSDDGGATWRELDLATEEGATDQPKVAAHGQGFIALWGTRSQPLRVVRLP